MSTNVDINDIGVIEVVKNDNNIELSTQQNEITINKIDSKIEVSSIDSDIEIVMNGRGTPGDDAIINGYNTIDIVAGDNITIEQEEDILTISATGEPQIQTDFNQTDNTKVDYIKNKPTKLSDFGNDGVFITSEDIPPVPTATSDLTNDSGFITEEDIPDIPTATSDLENDSGFITVDDIPPTDDALLLDQTTPQTVTGGMPIFSGLISNGNIGINSVSPLAPLQINLTNTGFARALRIVPQNNVNGYGGYIEFGASSTADGYGPQVGSVRTVGNGAGDLIIKTGGNAQKERFRITNSGLIGIGTDAPTNILDIKKSLNNDYVTGMRLQNPNAGTSTAIGIDFTLSSADVILSRIQAIRTNVGSSGVTDLVLSTSKASVGLTEAMRITGDGNIGIGTDAPTEKLDVSGNVKATSFIKTSGLSSQFLKADGSTDSNEYEIPIVDTYADLVDLDASITKAVVKTDTLADRTYITLDGSTQYEMLYVNPLPPLYGETYEDTYFLSTGAGGTGTMQGQLEASEDEGFRLWTLQLSGIYLGDVALAIQQNYIGGELEMSFNGKTNLRISGGWIDNLAYVDAATDEVVDVTMYDKKPDTISSFLTCYITPASNDATNWHRIKYALQPTPFEIKYSGIYEKIDNEWTLVVKNDKFINGNIGVPVPS